MRHKLVVSLKTVDRFGPLKQQLALHQLGLGHFGRVWVLLHKLLNGVESVLLRGLVERQNAKFLLSLLVLNGLGIVINKILICGKRVSLLCQLVSQCVTLFGGNFRLRGVGVVTQEIVESLDRSGVLGRTELNVVADMHHIVVIPRVGELLQESFGILQIILLTDKLYQLILHQFTFNLHILVNRFATTFVLLLRKISVEHFLVIWREG